MKYLALIALIGEISAIKLDRGVAIQTKWGKKNPHPGYEAGHDDFEGYEGAGVYDREVPERFAGPGSGNAADDQFMNSMITNYALELATPEGVKTGEFVFKES